MRSHRNGLERGCLQGDGERNGETAFEGSALVSSGFFGEKNLPGIKVFVVVGGVLRWVRWFTMLLWGG